MSTTLKHAPIESVRAALQQHLPGFDPAVAEILLGCVLANRIDGPPVWLMLVAPPSSGKTVLLEPLVGIDDARLLSSFTPQTLLSGKENEDGSDSSLLTALGEHPIIIIKELGTLLDDAKTRTQIFSQLREVYDGHFAKSFGTGLTREWNGKMTLLVGITPAVDLYSFDPMLGPRFFKARFESIQDPEALALAAWESAGNEGMANATLHEVYELALTEAEAKLHAVKLSAATLQKLAASASLLACLRGGVERNKYRKDAIELPAVVEGTPRIMKGLGFVARALAALKGERDLAKLTLLHRLVLDSMPEPRRSIFMAAVQASLGLTQPFATKDLEGIVSKSYTYTISEDLARVGILRNAGQDRTGRGRPTELLDFTDQARDWMIRSGILDYMTQ